MSALWVISHLPSRDREGAVRVLLVVLARRQEAVEDAVRRAGLNRTGLIAQPAPSDEVKKSGTLLVWLSGKGEWTLARNVPDFLVHALRNT